MADGFISIDPGSSTPPDGSASNLAAQYKVIQGTEASPKKHFPVLAFDGAGANEGAHWSFFLPDDYASGGTFKFNWRSPVSTSGNVKWQARVGAVTPTDADTPAEHAMAAAASVTTSVNTTEAGRLCTSTITLTTDSMAAGDTIFFYLFRDSADGSDTSTGDAEFMGGIIVYVKA